MIDVAVLTGGRSAEHDISLSSASQVIRHLDASRFRPWPVFLDREGRWWVADSPLAKGEPMPSDLTQVGMRPLRPGAALDRLLDQGVRVVFPVLHGAFGEDGTVQGLCELHDVAIVGSGTAASAVAMDKIRTRECLSWWGIPMAKAYVSETPAAAADAAREAERIAASVGFPCFLKMDMSGSTTGVTRADGPADVAAFLASGRQIGYRFLAEVPVRGEEISVGVLGNCEAELTALPPIGIYPRQDAYFTRRAKYEKGASEEVIPPRFASLAQLDVARDLATRCHRALQCDGMSRTDIILGADGPIVLEVNTIPGLTETSLLPQCASAFGLSFPALLSRLIELALARRPHPLACGRARMEPAG